VRFSILRPTGYYDNISIQKVAFDKDCGSNLLSAYYLATQGYHHIQSKSGKFLYFLDAKNRFRFAAVAIDEVYYLPSKQSNVNAKVLSAKSSHQLRTERVLREWHLRLGHVGIGRLMNILSRDIIEDAPHLARKDMAKVPFCNVSFLFPCTPGLVATAPMAPKSVWPTVDKRIYCAGEHPTGTSPILFSVYNQMHSATTPLTPLSHSSSR